MPLEWKRGQNPYVHHHFGKLRLGPGASPNQVVTQARNLTQRLAAGHEVVLAGLKLDEHAVKEASAALREPRTLAEELLLVHPPAPREAGKLPALLARLAELTTDPFGPATLQLVHPRAIFWFVPPPGPEALELPPLEALGLGAHGDEADGALDVVFDE
jgi:hypothetical protein